MGQGRYWKGGRNVLDFEFDTNFGSCCQGKEGNKEWSLKLDGGSRGSLFHQGKEVRISPEVP